MARGGQVGPTPSPWNCNLRDRDRREQLGLLVKPSCKPLPQPKPTLRISSIQPPHLIDRLMELIELPLLLLPLRHPPPPKHQRLHPPSKLVKSPQPMPPGPHLGHESDLPLPCLTILQDDPYAPAEVLETCVTAQRALSETTLVVPALLEYVYASGLRQSPSSIPPKSTYFRGRPSHAPRSALISLTTSSEHPLLT